jgi:SnoaL-like polyketide cyclase
MADKRVCWEGVRVSSEENKALVLRFFEEAWIKCNPAAVDTFVAAGYVEHAGFPGNQSAGRDGLKRLVAPYRGAFPELRSTNRGHVRRRRQGGIALDRPRHPPG